MVHQDRKFLYNNTYDNFKCSITWWSIILSFKKKIPTQNYIRTEIINFTLSKKRFSRIIYHALHVVQELLILKNHVSRNSISSFAINRNGILRFFGISVFGSRLQPRSEGVERSNLGTGHSLQPVHPAGKRTCTFLKRLIKRDKDERHVLERSLHPWVASSLAAFPSRPIEGRETTPPRSWSTHLRGYIAPVPINLFRIPSFVHLLLLSPRATFKSGVLFSRFPYSLTILDQNPRAIEKMA